MQPATISDQVGLSRRWRPALMSFFLKRVRNHAEAEDLTQEVFSRLLGNDEAPRTSPEAYVFQVAANLLRDRARRAKVRAAHFDSIGALDGQDVEFIDPYRIAAGRDALAVCTAGLQDLPERTRTIFVLYRIENIDLDVIAESLGISKSAVKKHVLKAMTSLMTLMKEAQ